MIPVVTEDPVLATETAILSEWLSQQWQDEPVDDSMFLSLDADGLMLHSGPGTLQIDWRSGALARRVRRPGGEQLIKALGRRGAQDRKVLDATAGLGRDGFLLASAGCQVTLIERHPVLFLMLQKAQECALMVPETAGAAARMQLVFGDSLRWMETGDPDVEVVYLDPMFPARNKSAAVKKEAQILQVLTEGGAGEDRLLLDRALAVAAERVVVKRPLHAPGLGDRKPDYVLSGRSTRFDILLSPHS